MMEDERNMLNTEITNLEYVLGQMIAPFAVLKGPEFVFAFANKSYCTLLNNRPLIGRKLVDAVPEIKGQPFIDLLTQVLETGETLELKQSPATVIYDKDIEPSTRYFDLTYTPYRNHEGEIEGVLASGIDVTVAVLLKQREQKSELQEQVHALFMKAPLAFCLLEGVDNRFVQANYMYYSITGRDASIIGRAYREVFPEIKNHSLESHINTVRETAEATYVYENEISLMINGVELKKYLTFYLQPHTDAEKVTGVFAIVLDMTEQIAARQELQAREEQFKIIVENIQNLAWMAHPDGNIYWYNKRWYEYTGTGSEETLGWGWQQVHHPDHIERVLAFVTKAWKGKEEFELTFPLKRYDGVYRWFLTRVFPILDAEGNVTRWIGTNTDVTDQKNAEERFRLLAESLPQLVWEADADGNIIYLSPRWVEYTGREAKGDEIWESIIHPDDTKKIRASWIRSLQMADTFKAEVRLLNNEGQYRWHSIYSQKVTNGDEQLSKWVGAFSDIHIDKSFSKELEKKVESRTTDLDAANVTLKKMNRELQTFAQVSSHDLQEPLRKVQLYTGRILDRDSEVLSPESKDYFERVQKSVKRMQTLIDNLLDYSVASYDKRVFENADLNEIIAEVKESFEEDLKQKNGILETYEMCRADVVPFQFRQLLTNLVGNSLKFASPDRPPHIKISSTIKMGQELGNTNLIPYKTYCHITITDNGIGFEQQYSEKIFEVFQRLQSDEQYRGTGIGLSIVKKIVENHDGIITAQSELNKGSIFNIYIPTR